MKNLNTIFLLFIFTFVLLKLALESSAQKQSKQHSSSPTPPTDCLPLCLEYIQDINAVISFLGPSHLFLKNDGTSSSLCISYAELKTCLKKCNQKSNHFSLLEMPCRFQKEFSEAIDCYQSLAKSKCKQKMKDSNDCAINFEKASSNDKANALVGCCLKIKKKYSCLKDFIVRDCNAVEQKLLFDNFQKTFNYIRYTDTDEDLLGSANHGCDDLLSSLNHTQDVVSPFIQDYDEDGPFYDSGSLKGDSGIGNDTTDDVSDPTNLAVNIYSLSSALFAIALLGQAVVAKGFGMSFS